MFSVPNQQLKRNSMAFENQPLIRATGFREYDARWMLGEQINLVGMQALGLSLGTYLTETIGSNPGVVVGHDYRWYSGGVKIALANGLMSAGCKVLDIGLALTPMAYYAQFALDQSAVAMVTASHNPNGWTGVKMGGDKPLTFGPEDMTALREITLSGGGKAASGGSLRQVQDFDEQYLAHLAKEGKCARGIKVVIACGNGTAGAFAPRLFRRLGCEVIELHCDLDHSFPHHNPNPEDMGMMNSLAAAVLETNADLGLSFDGDGDRCGVVDETATLHFSDRIGLLLARKFAAEHHNARFVVDVKSTAAFNYDKVLLAHNATTEYWKTGHSHIKRRMRESNALAGFEKSGHMFFAPPYGLGYDDGLAVGAMLCRILAAQPAPLSALMSDLPVTFNSPTMSAHCADENKYEVVAEITAHLLRLERENTQIAGSAIAQINTVNGARVTLDDGSWMLLRASSNAPELVVVLESPHHRERVLELLTAVREVLRQYPQVGAFNQTLE